MKGEGRVASRTVLAVKQKRGTNYMPGYRQS
jgi:hypothetical protein